MTIRLGTLLLIAAPIAAHAQSVSGVVTVAGTAAPIGGVVVTTMDSAGHLFSRALTDEKGRYVLPLAATARRLRAVRIGFTPSMVEVTRGPGADARVDVAMAREPFALATMVVSSDATCGGHAEEARRVLELWEQARSALLAAIVARESKPAIVQLVQYERRMDRPGGLITQQRVTMTTGRSTRPYAAARTGAELAASGYRRVDAGGQVYFAPDADVLFDETFGESHCFGFATGDRERAGQIGLTFKPRHKSRDFVDVEGALWLNEAATELMGLEYRYTGVDAEAIRAGMRGTMRFHTMPNGVAFIDSWSILLPVMSEVRVMGIDRNSMSHAVVNDLSETGGYVVRAAWPDSSSWSDPLGGIRGIVREQKTGAALQGVSVDVLGNTQLTDDAGAYALIPLPPGRYRLQVVDTESDRRRSQDREVDVGRHDTVSASFEVAPRERRSAPKPADDPRMLGFEQRRASNQGGQFISDSDLRARETQAMLTILRERMPGLRIVTYRGHHYAASFSAPSMSVPQLGVDGPAGCWVAVYRDGAVIFDEFDGVHVPPDVNDFVPARLAGIEYYPDAATVPGRFKSLRNQCGALLFWTRGK